MTEAIVGFIGGSGLYRMEGLADVQELEVETPFGAPSDSIALGKLDGTRVAFLPRHGRGHRYSPTEIPARANIYALKTLGVQRLVSVTAVGSLKEEVRPLDMVVPDQIIDRTVARANTFFDKGIAAHVGFADPFCPELSRALGAACQSLSVRAHRGGAFVVIEGPQFSTRAESQVYRAWGGSVIGMTAVPEAKLAREAEICYASLAMVTDYDTWHDSEADVSVELVLTNLAKNVAASQKVIRQMLPNVPSQRRCACGSALEGAIITDPDLIGKDVREQLAPIIGKYMEKTVAM